jgi:hypothetical protein
MSERNHIEMAWTQTGIWLKGQVNPLKIKLGVATIKFGRFNWFGTRMLTKTPMKKQK